MKRLAVESCFCPAPHKPNEAPRESNSERLAMPSRTRSGDAQGIGVEFGVPGHPSLSSGTRLQLC